MATDNTPPRLRLIVTIATIVVISLAGFDFVFKSYFAFMTDEAKHEKIAPKTDLLAQLLIEREALAAAKVPVDQAMSQVAKGTRPELIEPKPSEDLAPMTGWSKMPKPAPTPVAPSPGDAHTQVAPASTGDAGAADASATAVADPHAAPHATPDAGAPGAPKAPPAAKDAGAQPH